MPRSLLFYEISHKVAMDLAVFFAYPQVMIVPVVCLLEIFLDFLSKERNDVLE